MGATHYHCNKCNEYNKQMSIPLKKCYDFMMEFMEE